MDPFGSFRVSIVFFSVDLTYPRLVWSESMSVTNKDLKHAAPYQLLPALPL